ncbi:MAG: nucleotidyltransferase domain-containing protein [Chloroflexi bacterium]|nr:nucleotidyltransferase domain-containing protein [Chloroflexota bacterium]
MPDISPDLLQDMTRQLVAEFQPEQIVLFGSQAWGKPTAGSDVDLLVIVTDSAEKPIQRAQRAYRRLRDLPVPLDVLVKTRAEVERYRHVYASLECEILERGKVLYDRRS